MDNFSSEETIFEEVTDAETTNDQATAQRMVWNDERMSGILASMSAHRVIAPTGLADLDELLDGGLYPEVYVLAAEPGAGKTTLALQIADRIAQLGDRNVLFFSQEMSAGQIVAKSLSNLASKVCGNTLYAHSIMNPKRLSEELLNDRNKAIECYSHEIAPQIATLDEHVSINDIRRYVSLAAQECDFPPVVFVDYLQFMRPEDETASKTDTQQHTANMRGLVDLANRYKTPIFVISSKNRYKRTSIDLDSLAGSSDIEYGAGVVMFLAMDTEDEEEAKAMASEPIREVVLRVAKNRSGRCGDVRLIFDAGNNKFLTRYDS